jgi:hypothetical protein
MKKRRIPTRLFKTLNSLFPDEKRGAMSQNPGSLLRARLNTVLPPVRAILGDEKTVLLSPLRCRVPVYRCLICGREIR